METLRLVRGPGEMPLVPPNLPRTDGKRERIDQRDLLADTMWSSPPNDLAVNLQRANGNAYHMRRLPDKEWRRPAAAQARARCGGKRFRALCLVQRLVSQPHLFGAFGFVR